MEPEGSLLHLQGPATCPYPEPAESSPFPPSNLLKIRFNIILQSTFRVFQLVSFPQVSPPKPCMHLSCLPYMPSFLPVRLLMF